MTRPPRNPRRAYDHDGREIPTMTLGNMRELRSNSLALDETPGGVVKWFEGATSRMGIPLGQERAITPYLVRDGLRHSTVVF